MERWSSGEQYEPYVGRWSRLVATEFVAWLEQPAGLRWLDVGCGTGALSSTIVRDAKPARLLGVDRSEAYLEYARRTVPGEVAAFEVRDATELTAGPDGERPFDVVVSGLVLNFVPDRDELLRRLGGLGDVVAAYVWDYADGMQLMKYFWDVAGEVDPEHRDLHEGDRFPFCRPDALEAMWRDAGYADVASREIVVPTVFTSFEDYWSPFLGGQGAAPAYLSTLDAATRDRIRDGVRARLPVAADESISLTARAWAVRGASQA
ncbi:Methyltransferase type 12 [Kribbella flavida DSM 17836]|uniref:Methyltransferase type 12 n=1 Tax=Kribbella flavida (strain DSM 17836 / JCM 10339 / NBRC 14399) TaxID=479435 RepID=D2PQB2_KRIFD|nr:class I SAM-dependent methyltransferase [Kribbella flavida]ADB34814.1 Methyltransferase type 12 [Kribbella flavida DSM 17836]